MEIIHLCSRTRDPIQVIVDAIINAGPREDAPAATVPPGVICPPGARSVSSLLPRQPSRHACAHHRPVLREAAFRNVKTIAECLADELINTAKCVPPTRTPIKEKKDELSASQQLHKGAVRVGVEIIYTGKTVVHAWGLKKINSVRPHIFSSARVGYATLRLLLAGCATRRRRRT